MAGAPVLLESAGSAAVLTLNRPERHNALVPALLDSLLEQLAQVRRSPPAALVLRAAGRSFSTGGDVAGFLATPRAERRAYSHGLVGGLHDAMVQLLALPCPTIVLVQGMVTGGSAGLVLACDIAIGTPHASFAPWYTVVGFSPDGGWATLMPERIGRARALEVQLLNRRIEADEAHRLGLLQRLVAADRLDAEQDTCLATLSHAGPGSVAHTLAQLRPDPHGVAAGLERERQRFLEQIDTDEAEQGMRAFLAAKG